MTETPARIRWEPTKYGGWTGHVGTLAEESWLFQIWNAASVGGEWQLDSTLPGNFNRATGTDPDDLKVEAERLLSEFLSSLGAIFPDEVGEVYEFPCCEHDLEAAYAPGAFVRYQHPDAGWPGDQDKAGELLTHGRLYRVAWNDIGQSKTDIGLIGVKGAGFNSVLFEPVDVEDVTDAEAAEIAVRVALEPVPPHPGKETA